MHASLFLRVPRDGRANRRACKDAHAAATRDAKMCASEQLRGVRPSIVASVLLATFSPTIRRNVKGGLAIKEASPPPIMPPDRFFFQRPNSISSFPSPQRSIFTRVLCNSRVLTGGSGIETGIDWVNPRVPFQASTRILGLSIEAGIDWVNPGVPLRASVHTLPSTLKLSDFDYSADQNPLAVFALANWK